MKPIFSRGSSLQLRLVLVVLVVFVVLIADSRFGGFRQIRSYLDTAVSPFYFIANSPRQFLDKLSQKLDSQQNLQRENQLLRQKLLQESGDLLLLDHYKQENARLRKLLDSPLRQDEQKKAVQVIDTAHNPYSDQVVIDKGSSSGVHEGQPVIDDRGVVGQVVATAKYTSRVLLICDSTHALPVQVLRNDIRTIAAGNGCGEDLTLEHLPTSTDIRTGDVLVTSGLGGVFPEGYPVAIVSSVQVDNQRAWKVISARPTAGLQRLRYLLLLWASDDNDKNGLSPQQVHQVAKERLQQMLPHMITPGVTPSAATAESKPLQPAASQSVPHQSTTGTQRTTPRQSVTPRSSTPRSSATQQPTRKPTGSQPEKPHTRQGR